MFALPGSLLWLFLLVYFSCGQILDITSLDISNTSTKGFVENVLKNLQESKETQSLVTVLLISSMTILPSTGEVATIFGVRIQLLIMIRTSWKDDVGRKPNQVIERSFQRENKKYLSVHDRNPENELQAVNRTTNHNNEEEKENKKEGIEIPKLNSQDIKQLNATGNTTSIRSSETLPGTSQELNRTATSEFFGRNSKRRVTNRTTNGSRTTALPMMSEERRNSYLSIAERRKYYNRTRVQTKRPQLNDVELEYQETTNKLMTSSTEASLVNEIREIKQPVNKDSTREVTTENNQTTNQRVFVNSPTNETQGKPQTTRQSVIQSQYQFGQKLNLRKPVSRVQEISEERLKRKKEKTKTEFNMENSTNKLNKNYPTQSTKLVRIDKNLWATTTIPQADADNENFVMNSQGNATVLEKLVGYITTNNTKPFSNKEAATSDPNNEENNQKKVPPTTSFSPLPLNNVNVTGDSLGKNTSVYREISDIEHVYNQEILKINNFSPKAVPKESVGENSNRNNFKNTLTHPPTVVGFNNSAANTTNVLAVSKPSLKNGRISNHQVTHPTILKSNFKGVSQDEHYTTTPIVKAIYKEPSHFRTRFTQNETNASSNKQVPPGENNKNTSSGADTPNKTEEYPLTIELNENNKRVLSEMFQTVTTPKPKITAKGETATSQTKFPGVSKNDSTTDSSTVSTTSAKPTSQQQTTTTAIDAAINSTTTTSTESPQVLPPDDKQEDHKAQGTRYNTKFYISPKFNETKVIKVVEEDENDDEEDAGEGHSASVAIYVLAAFGVVPLLLALIFGTKFMMQRNQREYECESDAKSDVSANESQIKENKKKKGSTDLKKSPSNVTTITLVTATRLPRVQHWENSEKQGSRNWEFPRSNLKLKTILGQGNFGQVWKAEAEDMPGHEGVTRLVAVKTVKEGATEKEHTEFIKELEIMQQIGSHPNIVTLLGCCTDQEPYYLIMEYVKYGKLLTYLREHRVSENYYNFSNNSDALTSRDLTVFAYCVARGMEYLASRGIIHRDLAARNVLVDHNKLCKIADFGMSRSVRDFENGQVYEERQQKGALPIRWMAPESLVYSVFTYKSDVWSFGIVMWEIVTLGSTPYPNMGAREVMRKVRDGYRLERPSHCKPEFYRLISYCWAHDPNKRPDFSELRHELSNLLENPTKDGSYVDLDRFAVDNSFHVSSKTNDFRLLERNDFKTLQKLGDWGNKDWPEDMKKVRTKRGRNNGKGTVTLTGQGSFTVNSRILEKEFKII